MEAKGIQPAAYVKPHQAAGGKYTMTLQSAIERGLKEEASSITAELAEQKDALDNS